MTLLDDMTASPLIRTRTLEGRDDITACNFTRDAFRNAEWTALSTAARGLFLATSDGDTVVARGYEKFFNIGEPSGYETLHAFCLAAAETGADTVTLARKANGYLALIAPDPHGDGLLVLSKSGITDYSREAERLLHEQFARNAEIMARKAAIRYGIRDLRDALTNGERTFTLACEVLSDRDPHLIAEIDHNTLIALDVIANEQTFSRDMDRLRKIRSLTGLLGAERMIASDKSDDVYEGPDGSASGSARILEIDIKHLIEDLDQMMAGELEGVVLSYTDREGAEHFAKVKLPLYAVRKRLRSRIAAHQRAAERQGDVRGTSSLDAIVREHDLVTAALPFVIDGISGPVLDVPAMLRALPDLDEDVRAIARKRAAF